VNHATEKFGSTALTNNVVRNATIFIDDPSILLIVDPHIYRDTVAWFARSQLEKNPRRCRTSPSCNSSASTETSSCTSPRTWSRSRLRRAASPTTTLEGREAIEFIVIEKGLLAKQRVIDFTGTRTTRASLLESRSQCPRGNTHLDDFFESDSPLYEVPVSKLGRRSPPSGETPPHSLFSEMQTKRAQTSSMLMTGLREPPNIFHRQPEIY
jgi:hypothetical protein